MFTANLKSTSNSTPTDAKKAFASAKNSVSESLKSLGIEDTSDFATAIGYLLVGTYAIAMVINLIGQY